MKYFVIPEEAVLPQSAVELRHTLRAVYMALRSFSDFAYSPVFPSHKSIAERAGLKSRRTVIRAIGELEDLGFIKIEKRGHLGLVNRYHFNFFWSQGGDLKSQGGDLKSQGGDLKSQGGVTQSHRGCDLKSQGGVTQSHTNQSHLNHRNQPESFKPESTTLVEPSASILKEEKIRDAVVGYFQHASADNGSYPSNKRLNDITLVLLNTFPGVQPYDLARFILWYRKHVRDRDGSPYRLPTAVESITRHFANYWTSQERQNVKLLADSGFDVDTMDDSQFEMELIKLKYAEELS